MDKTLYVRGRGIGLILVTEINICYMNRMTGLQEIEIAVQKLPREKLAQFRRWFEEFDAQQWDAQFEKDVEAGKLDALADEAIEDLKEGRCTLL